MVRPALVLWLAAGCNQAYGLEPTYLVDARAEGCPPPGTPLAFESAPTTIINDRLLNYYQFDVGRTAAIAVKSNTVFSGALDAPLDAIAITDANLDHELRVARLAPEGDQIFVQIRDRTTDVTTVERFDRVGDAWQLAGTLPITLADEFDRISAPTARERGPRRMLLLTRASVGFAKVIQELVEDDAGNWGPAGEPYASFALGVDGIFDPNLSADGLRIVFSGFGFSGENAVYYVDRASVDERFAAATPVFSLLGNGLALSPFLADDCARMYFYAVPGIHYVRR